MKLSIFQTLILKQRVCEVNVCLEKSEKLEKFHAGLSIQSHECVEGRAGGHRTLRQKSQICLKIIFCSLSRVEILNRQ